MDDEIAQHYSQEKLLPSIQAALAGLGEGHAFSIDDIAPVDEFHIGGRRATAHLFDQLGLASGLRVLDVGAGIGGPARYVAHTYGCHVTGIDLTPTFCEVADYLTGLVGLQDRVSVHHGSALTLPFPDGSFDIAYMVHVGMNIEDKRSLFAEVHRVLRPEGVFAIYDVLKGPHEGQFRFPVPWATDPAHSFLATPGELAQALEHAGFTVERTEDRTPSAIEFFRAQAALQASGPRPPLGLHLLMGASAPVKYANMIANVTDGLCGPWEIIARRR